MPVSSNVVIMQVSDKSDLVKLIKEFRVVDLKKLLSFVNKSKTGLKEECYSKCLMIPFNEEIDKQIKEIYKYSS